jgi:hypothetical protein
MGNDVLSATDAIMKGRARAEGAFKKFLEQWSEPMIMMNMKAMWVMMPPEQKEALKKANPEMYEQIKSTMEVEGG